jgi:hypothetical protein
LADTPSTGVSAFTFHHLVQRAVSTEVTLAA